MNIYSGLKINDIGCIKCTIPGPDRVCIELRDTFILITSQWVKTVNWFILSHQLNYVCYNLNRGWGGHKNDRYMDKATPACLATMAATMTALGNLMQVGETKKVAGSNLKAIVSQPSITRIAPSITPVSLS